MPSSYTSNLRLTLPATGENSGTWGNLVNTGITNLIDTAIAGTANIVLPDANYTLIAANGSADEARAMFINFTGTLTATRNVICPSVSKLYFVHNNTSGGRAIVFKTASGSGVTVDNGARVALYCNGTDVLYAFDASTFLQAGTGAVVRTAQSKMRETISVEDYGAVGDGVTDDSVAFQKALDYAASIIGTNTIDAIGVEILLLNKKYFIGSTLYMREGGISLRGPVGRGAMLTGNTLILDIGITSNLSRRAAYNAIQNVHFYASTSNSTAVALRLYRTSRTRIINCNFSRFNIAIDGYRASTSFIHQCWFNTNTRTVNAQSFIRLQGTDESKPSDWPNPNTYTPGGGIHITDCEFEGAGTSGTFTEYGIEVLSVDGLYITQCHWTDCRYTLGLVPAATPANRTIYDVHVSNCYFDAPASAASEPKNVLIGGSVRESITLASNAVTRSVYEKIKFTGGHFRGDAQADRNCVIKVTDLDNWWSNSVRKLSHISFTGVTMGLSTTTALQVYGAGNSPINTYVEAFGIVVNGCTFYKNASSNPTGVGSAIQARTGQIIVSNNAFLADSGTSDYIVSIVPTDDGDDQGPGSVVVEGNDFSSASTPLLSAINVTPSATGAAVTQYGNVFAGPGFAINELYKATTTDATPTTVWSYVVPEGASGTCAVEVQGTNTDGGNAVAYTFNVGFRRNASGTTLSTGTSSFGADIAWNPDTLPGSPVTATCAGNTLTVTVTGLSVTTAGAFVIGRSYVIKSVGTTNFTLIGATSNTVGVEFVATGVGSGTGTAGAVFNWSARVQLSRSR